MYAHYKSNNTPLSVVMEQQQSQSPIPTTDFDTNLSQLLNNSCSSGSTTPIPILMSVISSHSLLHNANNIGTHLYPHPPPFSSTESNNMNIIINEGMTRSVSPYSPQEKKLRIERYRTKRNQRNFNKKIKYACRKTLADRRPRIRGRFARNDEINKNITKVKWSHISIGEEEDEEDENWMISIFDSIIAANLAHI